MMSNSTLTTAEMAEQVLDQVMSADATGYLFIYEDETLALIARFF